MEQCKYKFPVDKALGFGVNSGHCFSVCKDPGTLLAIICWPCLMHYAVIGYLVGWHGVGLAWGWGKLLWIATHGFILGTVICPCIRNCGVGMTWAGCYAG